MCVGVLEEEEKSVGPQFWARTRFFPSKKRNIARCEGDTKKKILRVGEEEFLSTQQKKASWWKKKNFGPSLFSGKRGEEIVRRF